MFNVETHENTRQTFERAYQLPMSGDRMLLVTGEVGRLTRAKKARIYKAAYSLVRSAEFPGTDDQAADKFDVSPFGRWEDLTIVHKTITGEDGETWGELDYTHSRGMGSRPLANVYRLTV